MKKLYAEEFACPCDAQKALKRHFNKSKFYEIVESEIEEHKKFESKGRPKPDSPYKLIYRIKGIAQEQQAVKQQSIQQSSCFVLGSTILKNVGYMPKHIEILDQSIAGFNHFFLFCILQEDKRKGVATTEKIMKTFI